MVSRSDTKRRRKDGDTPALIPRPIEESPKRAKVHAQRKFAQGSANMSSPVVTPAKDKAKTNGAVATPKLIPSSRPKTEDFLTFLCFRGTPILPPRLDFFNVATVPENIEDENGPSTSADCSKDSARNSRASSTSASGSRQQRSNERHSTDQAAGPSRRNDRHESDAKKKSGIAVQALRKKYQEQRLANHRVHTLNKLALKVKGKNMVRTRSSTHYEELVITTESRANAPKLASVRHKKTNKVEVRVSAKKVTRLSPHGPRASKAKGKRRGLRSGGQLPAGSVEGLKSDRKIRQVFNKIVAQAKPKKSLAVGKSFVSSLSDFSSDDDQPLLKKPRLISKNLSRRGQNVAHQVKKRYANQRPNKRAKPQIMTRSRLQLTAMRDTRVREMKNKNVIDTEKEKNDKEKKERELKEKEKKDKETKEKEKREKERKEKEIMEKERRDKELKDKKDKEFKEKERKERERKEKEKRDKELKEKERKEKELKEKELKESREKERKERELKELREKERKEKELREKEKKEIELKELRDKERKEKEQKELREKERKEKEQKELREKERKEKEQKELREKERKEKELKEKERKEKELKERKEKELKERKEKELIEKERHDKEIKERKEKEAKEIKEKEKKEKELKAKEIKEKELKEMDEREKKDRELKEKKEKEAEELVRKEKETEVVEPSVSARPTRKTKQAAAFYMELLGKSLIDPDCDDDDSYSSDSCSELPTSKRSEQRESEIKARARETNWTPYGKNKPKVKSGNSSKNIKSIAKSKPKPKRESTSNASSNSADIKSAEKPKNVVEETTTDVEEGSSMARRRSLRTSSFHGWETWDVSPEPRRSTKSKVRTSESFSESDEEPLKVIALRTQSGVGKLEAKSKPEDVLSGSEGPTSGSKETKPEETTPPPNVSRGMKDALRESITHTPFKFRKSVERSTTKQLKNKSQPAKTDDGNSVKADGERVIDENVPVKREAVCVLPIAPQTVVAVLNAKVETLLVDVDKSVLACSPPPTDSNLESVKVAAKNVTADKQERINSASVAKACDGTDDGQKDARNAKAKVNMSTEQIEKWLDDSRLHDEEQRKQWELDKDTCRVTESVPAASVESDGYSNRLDRFKRTVLATTMHLQEGGKKDLPPPSPAKRPIFHRTRPFPQRADAFSPENERSVYAFDSEPPASEPFRRRPPARDSRASSVATSRSEDEAGADGGGNSIAVQVNLDEATPPPPPEILVYHAQQRSNECSTQTEEEDEEDESGHLFYIPLRQGAAGGSGAPPAGMIQGVAVKLDQTGPNQRVIMRAKLVTKPPSFNRDNIGRSLLGPPLRRPVNTLLTEPVGGTYPPVGTVQPTARTPARLLPPDFSDLPAGDTGTGQWAPPPPPPGYFVAPTPDKVLVARKEAFISAVPPLAPLSYGGAVRKPPMPAAPTAAPRPPPEQSTSKPPPATIPQKRGPKPNTKKTEPPTCRISNLSTFPEPGSPAHLVEAPTFHPTEKEFQDPVEFIDRIRPVAEKFGLCRIVPPPNFKPECKVSDDMRFTAYNQYVHKTLHRWGPNVKEMMAIKKYLATQSIALTQPPWIGGMEIDLPRLYQTVQGLGGLKEVIEKKRWQRVADEMKITKSAQDRVTKLDDIYCKYLLPYETLSADERTKLFADVEASWKERESKVSSRGDASTGSDAADDESPDDDDDCEECIVKGRSMPLNQFYRIARNTMSMWFRQPEPPPAEVETEFWRHVTSRQSHVCVHAGSIESSRWGYGFPVSKNSPFARHPWNLKVFTNNNGSVLRSMGPIMGVTVPTLHVGMVFTTCCWYRDPHGLPWIEYLHTGASKVWYGIPDDYSSRFRTALGKLVPRYVENKTIWLPSDTAMVPPPVLVEHGVSLSRTVQEPGQFVVVFPRAFTSTICTGYLVSESVYFAQPGWLATAEQVFKDIQGSCEPSMFSLERLLFSIASDSRSNVEVLKQVLPMVQNVRERELDLRKQLFALGLKTSDRLPLPETNAKKRKMRPARDDQVDYECEICRANLYVSLVTNSHEEGVYCLPHAVELLSTKRHHLKFCKLLYTYDQAELTEVIQKLGERIEAKSIKKHGKQTLPAVK